MTLIPGIDFPTNHVEPENPGLGPRWQTAFT